jgi:GcrA cell cycle regulator
MPMTSPAWTPENVERLRVLWGLGWTASRIGAALGVSKFAIVNKAHRLGLLARPSPIIRDRAPRQPRKSRRLKSGVSTLPPLPSEEGERHA